MSSNPYDKDLKAFVAKLRSGTPSAAPNSVVRQILADDRFSTPLRLKTPPKEDGFWDSNGIGGRVLDILSRPLYAVGNLVESSFDESKMGGIVGNAINRAEGRPEVSLGDQLADFGRQTWEGLSGQDKVTPGEATQKEFNLSGPGGFVAGLAIDLMVDPLNLVGVKIPSFLRKKREADEAATMAVDSDRAVGFQPTQNEFTPAPETVIEQAISSIPTGKDQQGATVTIGGIEPPGGIPTSVGTLIDDLTGQKLPSATPPAAPVVAPERLPDVEQVIRATATHAADELGHGNIAQAYGHTKALKIAQGRANAQKLRGKDRVDFVRNEYLSIIKPAREGLQARGAIPFVSAGKGQKRHPITDVDIMELLPSDVAQRYVFNLNPGVKPTQIFRGVAAAIDNADLPVKELAVEVKAAMLRNTGGKNPAAPLEPLAETIANLAPRFVDKVAENRARFSLKHEEDVAELTAAALRGIHASIISGSSANVVKTVNKLVDDIGAVDGVQPATKVEAVTNALSDLEEKLGVGALETASINERVVRLRTAGASETDIKKAVRLSARRTEKSATRGMPSGNSETYAVGMFFVRDKLLHSFKRKSTLEKAMLELNRGQGPSGLAGMEIGLFNKGLGQIDKYPISEVLSEFSKLRLGEPPVNSALSELLRASVGKVFETSDEGNDLYGAFFRNGGTIDQINASLESVGIGHKFELPEGVDYKSAASQWRGWDIADPVDFLSRAYGAVRRLTANQSVALTLENNFGSVTRQPGYVRIVPAKDSMISTHLDPNVWYPREVAESIDYLEWAAGARRSFKGQAGFGPLIDRVYDPILSIWKTYMTIPRPGHHARNFAGDATLSHLAGMNNLPKWYGAAIGIIKNGGANYTQVVDGVKMSGDELYRLFKKNGLRPDYHTAEDIIDTGARTKVERILLDNKGIQFAGRVSEEVSAAGRFSQFLWEMNRPISEAKSLEQKAAIAARRVRRQHPDSAGLNPAEAKYMRRLIPFYSWIRQALPLVAEATITRPGRILAVPKGAYNMAIANGVEPSSLSDPFPENYPYPSFIKDNILGPVTPGGTGFNLGTPVESAFGEVLNPISAEKPGVPIVEALSPILKAPIELASGSSIVTGLPISDRLEYVEQQVPLLGYASNISGHSVLGSLLSMQPDPLVSVQKGNREKWEARGIVNFLTGAGMKNYQQPNYLRIGLNERRAAQE